MQQIIQGFLRQARFLVTITGSIQLAYVDSSYYTGRFHVDEAVKLLAQLPDNALRRLHVVRTRTEPFDANGAYRAHGYEHRRTNKRASHNNPNPSMLATFQLR
jgi:hypothetical protein